MNQHYSSAKHILMENLTTSQQLEYDPIHQLTNAISPAMSILITTVCVFLGAFMSSYLSLSRRNKKIKLPPGPKGLPFLGNLLQVLGAHPHRALTAMQKKHGHLLFVRLGSVPTLVLDTAELIDEVTKEQDIVFSSRPQTTFTEIVAYDAHDFAMAPYGAHWRHMRRICVNELLTPKRLESTARERRDECMHMVRDIYATTVTKATTKTEGNGDGKVKKAMVVIDMRDVFAGVSMNVMCRMLLGRREFAAAGCDPKDFKHLIHELFRLLGALNLRDFLPALGWLDLQGFERDMRQLRQGFDEVLDAIIQEHRDLAAGKLPGGKPNDFITILLDLPGEKGAANLDDKTIKALILDMMAGATDTSAVTNEWAMAEVIRNPAIQQKIQDEIDSVVGSDRLVEEEDLYKLPYLMCVVKETFRLHPAGPFSIPRMSMKATQIAGYDIPKGTRVLINIHSLGRSEETWAEPLVFRPERWANENLSQIQDPEFRILPFGNGRRGCPGSNLGATMVLLVLSRLLHGFTWSLPPGTTSKSIDMEEDYGCTTPLRTRLRAVATPRLATHLYKE